MLLRLSGQGNRELNAISVASTRFRKLHFEFESKNVRQTRKASELARDAAQNARNSIRSFEAVVDISAVIGLLEEIKRAHRNCDWPLLPDRYASLRKKLISVRRSRELSDGHAAVLQAAIVNLSDIERAVEKALPNVPPSSPAKFNALLSNNIDGLTAVLAELKFADSGE